MGGGRVGREILRRVPVDELVAPGDRVEIVVVRDDTPEGEGQEAGEERRDRDAHEGAAEPEHARHCNECPDRLVAGQYSREAR